MTAEGSTGFVTPRRHDPPSVGSTMFCWWEDDAYQPHTGSGIVVASSRSKRSLTDAEALERLRDGFDDTVEAIAVHRWWTVTKADAENGDGEQGSYSANGTGSAWVDVAVPVFAQEALDG